MTQQTRLHRRHRDSTTGQPVRLRGWLHNRRSSGKIHFLTLRDGTRLHPVRDVEAGRRRRDVQGGRSPRAGERDHRRRHRPRRRARARRLRGGRRVARDRLGGEGLSDHAEGARRRLPDGPPPPVDPLAAAAGDPARPPRGDQRRPRLLQRPRASSSPTRRSSRPPRARARRRCSRSSTSRTRRRT